VDFAGPENVQAIKAAAQKCIEELLTNSSPYFEKVTAAMQERKNGKTKGLSLWRKLRGDQE
jgi:hypothetical protein